MDEEKIERLLDRSITRAEATEIIESLTDEERREAALRMVDDTLNKAIQSLEQVAEEREKGHPECSVALLFQIAKCIEQDCDTIMTTLIPESVLEELLDRPLGEILNQAIRQAHGNDPNPN